MDDDMKAFYICIGRAIATSGAIEGKIDCIITDEYLKGCSEQKRKGFNKEILNIDAISFSKKIDIFFSILKRRNISLDGIDKKDFKDFIDLRNKLAHCKVEYTIKEDDCSDNKSLKLEFHIRNCFQSLADMESSLEKLGEKICLGLERNFFNVLWGNSEDDSLLKSGE